MTTEDQKAILCNSWPFNSVSEGKILRQIIFILILSVYFYRLWDTVLVLSQKFSLKPTCFATAEDQWIYTN